MKIPDHSVPVVVLKSQHHSGLCIARSLGRLGVPVYVVDSRRFAPAASSRYCAGRLIWDLDQSPAAESVEFLLSAAKRIGGSPLLIPTFDTTAIFVAENAERLKTGFRFPAQDPSLVNSLYSKKGMHFLAKRCGVPTPDAFFPQSRAEVVQFSERTVFPVMVKPIEDRLSRRRAGTIKRVVHNRRELLDSYDQIEDPRQPNLLLQEYIPGGPETIVMFNGYFDGKSECLVGFTGKKLRQFPAYTGPTCLGICETNETVAHLTKVFMKVIGYRGILDIGYRYDARDGLYKVLDVNPRIGSTFRLFMGGNGLDVVRALYLDMTGQPVPESQVVEGRKWIVEEYDLVSSVRYLMDGELTLAKWIRSFRGVQETTCFASDDLLPMLSIFLQDFRELFGSLWLSAVRPPAGRATAQRGVPEPNPLP
jgi:predicted ATP-grasp superfamily ATP-dependent carboligase